MKKHISIILLLVSYNLIFSQGLINNGAKIVASSGTYIYIDGDSNGGFTNQSSGTIDSDGTIILEGDWENNGSTGVYTSIDNTGVTEFKGSALQEIGGSATTDFENLTVNNSGQGVFISHDENIHYTLNMADGDFDLRNNNVELVSSSSEVTNEASTKRIKSTDGTNDGEGTGTIYTTRSGETGNIANLGLSIPSISGNVTVTRGHLKQQGTGSFTSNYSVFRYFKVESTDGIANGGGGLSVTFVDCYTPELNGHNSGELIMYQWYRYASDEYWHPVPDNSSGGSVSITQTLDNNSLDYIKVTLGSETNPLPIELKDFYGKCENQNIVLNWESLSEINNDYYLLESSEDGEHYTQIAEISGAGNSSYKVAYQYIVSNTNDNYFRLSQVDYNGVKTILKTINIDCSGSNFGQDLVLYPNPANNYLNIKYKNENQFVRYNITDIVGQTLQTGNIQENTGLIQINLLNLTPGVYNIELFNQQNQKIVKQFIVK